MEERNVVPVIPMRKTRKARVAVDQTFYRLRNLVERCFNKLKNARRVATRYDKTAESFLGFIDMTSIRLWLRHLSTRPRHSSSATFAAPSTMTHSAAPIRTVFCGMMSCPPPRFRSTPSAIKRPWLAQATPKYPSAAPMLT
jgi:hypothetical protein